MDEASYLRIIGDKTASLLSTCCEIGATSVTADPGRRLAMKEYGEMVGLAFQVRDDLLDYIGRKSITGKPTGLDLTEKKLTLPLVEALRRASQKERKEILAAVRNGGKKVDVGKILEFVTAYGGIIYADGKAKEFAARAQACLASLPDSPARASLMQFADFVVTRDK
jgi:octaprenyl-diphosphate synthase